MKWLWSLGLAGMLAVSAEAWQPSGWVYMDYPWAYESTSGDWYWVNAPDSQWVVNMDSDEWWTLGHSALRVNWGYYQWPYAWSESNGCWYWFNTPDVQLVLNMRTGAWTPLGVP